MKAIHELGINRLILRIC